MGSLSFSEIVVIVLVILIVFGPNRLPDLARKAGEFMNKVRNASSSMTDALGVDYEETVEPFLSAKRDFDGIKSDFSKTVTTFGQSATISDDAPKNDVPDQQAADVEPVATAPEEDAADDAPTAETPSETDSADDSTAAT
jgi:TatA/E family protein of Tat protein translocase